MTFSVPSLRWIDARPVPLDHAGPIDRPFDIDNVALVETGDAIVAIEEMAKRYPDKPVIFDGVRHLTYAEFLDRAYGLAGELIARFPAGSVLSSLVHNSAVAPIVVFASAMAGCVLVPIDATHPLERQSAIWSEAGAVALLVSPERVDDSFVGADIPRILVDPARPTGASRPVSRCDPSLPLFVAFTSGSTGRPKGVAGGGYYGALALGQFIRRLHINHDDVILNLASLSTGGARDAFVALATGATLRICDIRGGLTEVLRVLGEEGVTLLSFIPSALRMILGIEGADASFRHLRVLDLHGESILASDIELFRRKLPPDCRISITMGSIEAGAVFSWFVEDERIESATAPVGYLLPGHTVALLDEDGVDVEPGEIGELFVRGRMAVGAWKQGRLARGPFIADPDDRHAYIYPMGDLMRQRPDGLFEYIGRKNRQVKIHGLWAELGEVETALRGIDGVAEAVVIATRRGAEGDRLVGFVVVENGATPPSLGTVRKAVAAETAEHMAPAAIHALPAIPRLANFKPDLVRLEALANE
jgi:acyl-coenzyme A synthetase/AMP-(fatty) acid ligase